MSLHRAYSGEYRSTTVDFDHSLGKGSRASWGKLCPAFPLTIWWEYLPEDFLRWDEPSVGGATPLDSPSRVIAGTVTTGPAASRFSSSSYLGSPLVSRLVNSSNVLQ
jgi:hypothetical protein